MGSFSIKSYIHLILVVLGFNILVSYPASAQTIWSGAGVDNQWSTGPNWVGNSAPASSSSSDVIFDGTTQLTNNVNSAWTIRGLTFSNTAGAFVLTNQQLTIHGGITNFSTATQTISNNIVMGANQYWFMSNGTVAYAGVMSGGFSYYQRGTGTVNFLGANTYSGATEVQGGTLIVSGAGRINHAGQDLTLLNQGMLIVNNGGAVTNNRTYIGSGTGTGSNTLTLSGSTVTNRLGDWLMVGWSDSHNNTVNISNGATLTAVQGIYLGYAGSDIGSSNAVNVSGATVNLGNEVIIGRSGTNNSINIDGSSTFTLGNGDITIAQTGGLSNSLSVNNSTLIATNSSLYVGRGSGSGNGSYNSASFTNSNVRFSGNIQVGVDNTFSGANGHSNTLSIVGSGFTNGGQFQIGGGDANSAFISNSTVQLNNYLILGGNSGADSNSLVVVNSTITQTNTTTGDFRLGESANSSYNTATFSNSTLNTRQIRIGGGANSVGNTVIFQDSIVTNLSENILIGFASGATSNKLTLNHTVMSVTNGAIRDLNIGDNANNNGFIISNGSTFNLNGKVNVGLGGFFAHDNYFTVDGSTGNISQIQTRGQNSTIIVTNGGRLYVTNDIRLGDSGPASSFTLTGSGSSVVAGSLLAENAAPFFHKGGTLTVSGGFTNQANASIFDVGDGIQTATLNLGAGSKNVATINVASNGTLNMGSNSKLSGNMTVSNGGTLNFNGTVTNAGVVNFLAGSTVDTLQAGDLFRVENASFVNNTTLTIETDGGASVPSFSGIEIFGVGSTFTNNGTINFDFAAPLASGVGTYSNPYNFGIRATDNIFSNYFSGVQGGSGLWSPTFSFNNWSVGGATTGATNASSGQYITYYFSAGYYYLVVIPEPSTYVLMILGMIMSAYGLYNSRRKKSRLSNSKFND